MQISKQSPIRPTNRQPLLADIISAIKLSAPMAGAQLATIALQVTDNIVCGRLGAEALGGVGLGSAAYSMLFYPCMGSVAAVSPLVAHAHGAQDKAAARRSLQHALMLALVLGLMCFMLFAHVGRVLTWMGQPPELVRVAEDYMLAMRWGALPALLVVAMRGFLDSLSLPRVGLIVAISGIVVNLFANWVLVFGHLGSPALGVAGSGWATCGVNIWMALCLAGYIAWERLLKDYHVFAGPWRLELTTLGELLRLGLPMAMGIVAEVWLFTGMSFLMGRISTTAVAAHQIALNAASVAFMIAMGTANASTVRVGQAMGRGDLEGARRAGLIGMALGMSCMSLTGLIFWLFPLTVIGVYLNLDDSANASVIALAAQLIHLAALFQIFDALQVTSQGALRGLKDSFAPMLIGFASYWGVGLGSGFWLGFGLGWGAEGLWVGLILGLLAAGLALSTRFIWRLRRLRQLRLLNSGHCEFATDSEKSDDSVQVPLH